MTARSFFLCPCGRLHSSSITRDCLLRMRPQRKRAMGGTNMIPKPYAMLYRGRQGQLKSKQVYIFTLARASSPQIPFITDSELDWKYWKIIRKRSIVLFWPGVLLLGNPWAAWHSLPPFAPPSAATGQGMQLSLQSVGAGGWGWKRAAVAGEKLCAGASPLAYSFHRSVSHPVLVFQLVAFLGEQMGTASSSCFFCPVFHSQGCPT